MFEVKGTDRLSNLCYRCHRCKRLITKLEILDKWHEAEKDTTTSRPALCNCGSRHITPTNPHLSEELTLPRVWKLWFYEVLVPWLRKKLGK